MQKILRVSVIIILITMFFSLAYTFYKYVVSKDYYRFESENQSENWVPYEEILGYKNLNLL